jgi:hypothetical protein
VDGEADHHAPTGVAVPHRFRPGLELLWQARCYAEELACSVWEFAVEIASLRDAGLTNSDLRWLACKGYLEHSEEIRAKECPRRQFQSSGVLFFTKRSCFVLTPTGLCLAAAVMQEPVAEHDPAPPASPVPSAIERLRPRWDRDRQEFRVGGQLVKAFKLPSPNQEMILMAFEEEGWPPRIDDPLPPHSDVDPKRRLHDTIKSLNRNQKRRLIRFMGDGTGQGVRWHLVVPATAETLPR